MPHGQDVRVILANKAGGKGTFIAEDSYRTVISSRRIDVVSILFTQYSHQAFEILHQTYYMDDDPAYEPLITEFKKALNEKFGITAPITPGLGNAWYFQLQPGGKFVPAADTCHLPEQPSVVVAAPRYTPFSTYAKGCGTLMYLNFQSNNNSPELLQGFAEILQDNTMVSADQSKIKMAEDAAAINNKQKIIQGASKNKFHL
jgi:hypothetical protein